MLIVVRVRLEYGTARLPLLLIPSVIGTRGSTPVQHYPVAGVWSKTSKASFPFVSLKLTCFLPPIFTHTVPEHGRQQNREPVRPTFVSATRRSAAHLHSPPLGIHQPNHMWSSPLGKLLQPIHYLGRPTCHSFVSHRRKSRGWCSSEQHTCTRDTDHLDSSLFIAATDTCAIT